MSPTFWFLLAGVLLIFMALSMSVLRHLPLSSAMLYLGVGVALGPAVSGAIALDPIEDAALIERVTEIGVSISLFTAGLKLRLPLREPLWRAALRLASGSMVITVGLVTLVGWALLDLPVGAAVLLGGILAPTDPVLASDVQVEHAGDVDELRFALTGEAGLNDGTAFPFVMLGLGLLGLHPLGAFGWTWLTVDVLWAVSAGLGLGALLGTAVGKLVLYLRKKHREAVGLDDFLALGLLALAYGAALAIHAYAFLAVFAAGFGLRRVEMRASGDKPLDAVEPAPEERIEDVVADSVKGPARLAKAVLAFNEQLERIGELSVVVLIGAMLAAHLSLHAAWFAPLLFFGIRPVAIAVGLARAPKLSGLLPKSLAGWFGIRGIGSLYYLAFAITHGLPRALSERITALTLTVIAASIVVHGISVTPLMKFYRGRVEAGQGRAARRARA